MQFLYTMPAPNIPSQVAMCACTLCSFFLLSLSIYSFRHSHSIGLFLLLCPFWFGFVDILSLPSSIHPNTVPLFCVVVQHFILLFLCVFLFSHFVTLCHLGWRTVLTGFFCSSSYVSLCFAFCGTIHDTFLFFSQVGDGGTWTFVAALVLII